MKSTVSVLWCSCPWSMFKFSLVYLEFKECFNLYATKGLITSLAELSKIMRSLGLAPTNKELSSYFQNKGTSITKVRKDKQAEQMQFSPFPLVFLVSLCRYLISCFSGHHAQTQRVRERSVRDSQGFQGYGPKRKG